MAKLLLIAAFGGLGSVLRFLVAGWCQRLVGGTFPVGTLAVNVVGCLAIGACGAFFFGPYLVRDEFRLALTVGLLGGFTTFSSFGWETLSLLTDGQWAFALVNVLASNALGLAAAWAGYRIGVVVFGV